MAKDKDRAVNPAVAQRKADKAKTLKKGKAAVQTQRNERLANRNPNRLQQEIDELKSLDSAGGFRPRDKQKLEQLERQLKSVQKAREALGDKAPQFGRRSGGDREGGQGRGGFGGGILGKRRRGHDDASASSNTDDDVKNIPMPKDVENMPPVPRKQRPFNPNDTPMGESRMPHALPEKPAAPKIVYESAPVMRDLKKEAIQFVPTSVARNLKRMKGEVGRLLEPEEMDKLEEAGYRRKKSDASKDTKAVAENMEEGSTHKAMNAAVEDDPEEELDEFERQLRQIEAEQRRDESLAKGSKVQRVELEEVEDEEEGR
ncbi:hypothetical protein K402DRAFT_443716 [Aulographum hederae CBS 113979]|uniref:Wbp11/ELF5/Saf1 N-terminal domain-containing protein n=1 Tax=Aulographum hederae CBS 113979 TaxID=1176131 RepID=A0A6G1HFA6_9PEZI|nr:hypothetical protein K402DRAFT_443716 [Aulographum hederae CBS 113979]